jgi:hypothetical protein
MDLSDLSAEFPALSVPATQALLLQRSLSPGFLGLDLPFYDALALLGRLRTRGAVGHLTPVVYRQPRVSIDEALLLAQPVLIQREATAFTGYQFGPVTLWREEARWWVIGAVSEQLLNEGHIPGGVSTVIDKLDGHIWTFEEIEALMREDRP